MYMYLHMSTSALVYVYVPVHECVIGWMDGWMERCICTLSYSLYMCM